MTLRHAFVVAMLLTIGCDVLDKPPAQVRGTTSPAPTTATADQVLRIGGEVTAPVLIKNVRPKYHPGKRRVAGVILLEMVVTKSGAVRDVKVLNGADDPMTADVVEAVRQWKFKPATRHGQPVDVIYNVSTSIHVR